MKKFSELKVGDSLFVYFEENYLERKVEHTFKDNKCIFIVTSFDNYTIISEKESDFKIIEYDIHEGIQEAISTSMDRLLLECSE